MANENDLNKTFVKSPSSHNITKSEKDATTILSKNDSIVIKKADKGNNIVI